ncbi:MAG: 4Fe-4S dicluster domain-containing protein [Ruminococcus sp.]|jgi:2-oxoglutarate ferredoxin oxidoreductase subunit delta|nr:4Fe-4S dicluster domain-containing protein [Ruminococcus sp.]
MAKISIRDEKCKGCSMCINVCPKACIELSKTHRNRKGYMTAQFVKPESCIGCAMCATMCPDCCITVEK